MALVFGLRSNPFKASQDEVGVTHRRNNSTQCVTIQGFPLGKAALDLKQSTPSQLPDKQQEEQE